MGEAGERCSFSEVKRLARGIVFLKYGETGTALEA